MKKLIDYFPITSDGLFTAFVNPVWAVAFPDTAELDTYFMFKYGERLGYSKLDMFADSEDGTIKGDKLDKLAAMILNIKGRGWEQLYKVYTAEYDPLNNTDFKETYSEKTDNLRDIDSVGTNIGNGITNSTATNTGANSGANNVFGFNSVSAVGDSESTGTNTDTTTANTTTNTTGGTTDKSTIKDDGTKITEHTKAGNIGVTETVTLLKSQVDFWKWSFIDDVCKDICDIIALSIY